MKTSWTAAALEGAARTLAGAALARGESPEEARASVLAELLAPFDDADPTARALARNAVDAGIDDALSRPSRPGRPQDS